MYRNEKLLASANGRRCAMCGAMDGTTVAAHSNLLEHGKGRGIKAHDCFVAYLCHRCHTGYDSGHIGQHSFSMAMHKTRAIAKHLGLISDRDVMDVVLGHYSKIVRRA